LSSCHTQNVVVAFKTWKAVSYYWSLYELTVVAFVVKKVIKMSLKDKQIMIKLADEIGK